MIGVAQHGGLRTHSASGHRRLHFPVLRPDRALRRGVVGALPAQGGKHPPPSPSIGRSRSSMTSPPGRAGMCLPSFAPTTTAASPVPSPPSSNISAYPTVLRRHLGRANAFWLPPLPSGFGTIQRSQRRQNPCPLPRTAWSASPGIGGSCRSGWTRASPTRAWRSSRCGTIPLRPPGLSHPRPVRRNHQHLRAHSGPAFQGKEAAEIHLLSIHGHPGHHLWPLGKP